MIALKRATPCPGTIVIDPATGKDTEIGSTIEVAENQSKVLLSRGFVLAPPKQPKKSLKKAKAEDKE